MKIQNFVVILNKLQTVKYLPFCDLKYHQGHDSY